MNKFTKVLKVIFEIIYGLIALFFFGDVLFGVLSIDWSLKNAIFMIIFKLAMMLPLVMYGVYEIVYKFILDEKKPSFHKMYSIIFLAVAIVLNATIRIYLIFTPYALIESGQSLLWLTYMTSIPIGEILIILLGVIPPLVSLILYFVKSRKNDKKIKCE